MRFRIKIDDQIERYFELGCEVKGMGRGHIKKSRGWAGGTSIGSRER